MNANTTTSARSRNTVRIGMDFQVRARLVENLITGQHAKNGYCKLEISRDGFDTICAGVDIELSCLPSQSLLAAYGIVYLTNFKIDKADRTALDVHVLEQVAFDAICKFYHRSVSVLTTPMWFDALDSGVGIASLTSFAKRFNLALDTRIGTMIRKGDMYD